MCEGQDEHPLEAFKNIQNYKRLAPSILRHERNSIRHPLDCGSLYYPQSQSSCGRNIHINRCSRPQSTPFCYTDQIYDIPSSMATHGATWGDSFQCKGREY